MNSTTSAIKCPQSSDCNTPSKAAPFYSLAAPPYTPEIMRYDEMQEAYTIHIDQAVVVAGDVLTGYVLLDTARAQADHLTSLKLQLQGTSTTIVYPSGFGHVPVKATNKFFQLVLPEPVWTVATTSDQFSPTTRAPFRIKLPEDMAPSVADGGKSREVNVASLSAKIEYTVVVQGTRRGFFRLGRWVEKTVSIVKSAASEDVHTKVTLATGPWTGSWRVLSAQTVVSTGGTVRAELTIPNLSSYPSEVPLAYQLRITTQSDLASDSMTEAGVSEVPPDPSALRLQLVRRLSAEADFYKAQTMQLRPLGGLGSAASRTSVRAKVEVPTFVPSSTNSAQGTWQRTACFEGTLTFSDTPSFSMQTVSVLHALRLHVPIPGTTTILSADWDVTINSGVQAAPPAFDFGPQVEDEAIFAAPPPSRNATRDGLPEYRLVG